MFSFSPSSRSRTPRRTVRAASTAGTRVDRRGEFLGLRADQGRERHAVHVAAPAGAGRVHVTVGVDPDEADRLPALLGPVRRSGRRPGAETVVAAEHERDGAVPEAAEHRVVQPLAHAGDLADVLLRRVSRRAGLGMGTCRSPRSVTGWPSAAMR